MGMPDYWEMDHCQAKVTKGLSLVRIREKSALHKIQACCTADDPSNLGKGQDYIEAFQKGNQPAAVGAWRIENPTLWLKYAAGRQHVADACKALRAPKVKVRPHRLCGRLRHCITGKGYILQ
jgi:hypothetical protein